MTMSTTRKQATHLPNRRHLVLYILRICARSNLCCESAPLSLTINKVLWTSTLKNAHWLIVTDWNMIWSSREKPEATEQDWRGDIGCSSPSEWSLLPIYTWIPQSFYSPDLVPCEFWIFPEINTSLKGKVYQIFDTIKKKYTKTADCDS